MWRALWLLWTILVISVTTMPWSNFKGHSHWDDVRWIPFQDRPLSPFDIVANVLLFVPFGFFYVRSISKRGGLALLWAVLCAALISAAVELFQCFCHNRISSMTDLCTNVIGATVGAAIAISRKDPSEYG